MVSYNDDLLQGLFGVQPIAALDGLCPSETSDVDSCVRILGQVGNLRINPFDMIRQDDLFSWCDRQPSTRYPAVAAGATVFAPSNAGGPEWTNIALQLFDRAPDRIAVLKEFTARFSPTHWRGPSRAAIVASNTKLLDAFTDHPDPAVRQFIGEEKTRLARVVDGERHIDMLIQREMDERFE